MIDGCRCDSKHRNYLDYDVIGDTHIIDFLFCSRTFNFGFLRTTAYLTDQYYKYIYKYIYFNMYKNYYLLLLIIESRLNIVKK